MIDVVGGVYRELCAFPVWDQYFGSAGRAACALSGRGAPIRLHTLLADNDLPKVQALCNQFEIDLVRDTRDQAITFDYLNSLSMPRVRPGWNDIKPSGDFRIEAERVVAFGMLEATPVVYAKECVYDPQSPGNPLSFAKTGSKAERLAIIANANEISKMSGQPDPEEGARALLRTENAEVIVVKQGLSGAFIQSASGSWRVPAYEARNVFSIGSGDVFVAAFAYAWLERSMAPHEAADYASRATAAYLESRSLPFATIEHVATRSPVKPAGGRIYIAGPFRETSQRMLVNEAREHLTALGMQVFSPVHDIGHGTAEQVVKLDLAAIEQCDAVFAILNGSSPGTLFEVGYAAALKKPVFCVAENMRQQDLKLPVGAGCHVHEDFVSALFQIACRT